MIISFLNGTSKSSTGTEEAKNLELDPNPLLWSTDPRIQIRVRANMSRIRSTALEFGYYFQNIVSHAKFWNIWKNKA